MGGIGPDGNTRTRGTIVYCSAASSVAWPTSTDVSPTLLRTWKKLCRDGRLRSPLTAMTCTPAWAKDVAGGDGALAVTWSRTSDQNRPGTFVGRHKLQVGAQNAVGFRGDGFGLLPCDDELAVG